MSEASFFLYFSGTVGAFFPLLSPSTKYIWSGFVYYVLMLSTFFRMILPVRLTPTPLCLLYAATGAANLTIYTALPPNRQGLLNSMLQVLRTSMSVTGCRVLLNVRSVINQRQTSPPIVQEPSGMPLHFYEEGSMFVMVTNSVSNIRAGSFPDMCIPMCSVARDLG